jgi:hypothetical protein
MAGETDYKSKTYAKTGSTVYAGNSTFMNRKDQLEMKWRIIHVV